MSTYSADKNQDFEDLPDMKEELAEYDVSKYRSRKRKTGTILTPKRIIIAVIVIVLVLGSYGVAFAVSAKQAKSDADTLMTQGKALVTQLKNGDNDGALQTVQALGETASKLNDNVSSPLWTIATIIPYYGDDVKDVRVLANVADTLCQDTLGSIVEAMPTGGIKGVFTNGGFNVPAITGLLTSVGDAQPTIQQCAEQIESMPDPNLEQLVEPVSMVKEAVSTLDTLAQYADQAAAVLPGMLGADGAPSTYLLTAANNAELRAHGGMPGSFSLVTVTDGRIEIGGFGGEKDSMKITDGTTALELTSEEVQLFGNRIGLDIRDTTYNPSFPRAAELERAIWERSGNPPVDGVIQIDPIFLQSLLALTGAATLSDGTVLDGSNTAQELMNGVYIRLPDDNAQDAFFAEAAGVISARVFENLSDIDFTNFIKLISSAIDNNHFMMWAVNPEEEALIVEFGLGGVVPSSEEKPSTGIYVAATYPTKACWYLDIDTQVGEERSNADGSKSYDVTVQLTNTLTDEVAAGLPGYIMVSVPEQRTLNEILLDVYLFAPLGGSISDMQADGYFLDSSCFASGHHTRPGSDSMTQALYGDNEVWYGVTGIAQNEVTTLKYTVTTSTKATEPLRIDVTPQANESL